MAHAHLHDVVLAKQCSVVCYTERCVVYALPYTAPTVHFMHSRKAQAFTGKQLGVHGYSASLSNSMQCMWLFSQCVFTAIVPTQNFFPAEDFLYGKSADGKWFVDILKEQGIVAGIKVDTGMQVSTVRDL